MITQKNVFACKNSSYTKLISRFFTPLPTIFFKSNV